MNKTELLRTKAKLALLEQTQLPVLPVVMDIVQMIDKSYTPIFVDDIVKILARSYNETIRENTPDTTQAKLFR